MKVILRVILCLACTTGIRAKEPAAAPALRPDPARLAGEVNAFATRKPKTGGILFIGSSSIRLWTRLKEDFPGLPVVNRGFGGSIANDMIRYFDQLVVPSQPKLVVVYTGSNDLNFHLGVDETFSDYTKFLGMLWKKFPDARVIINSVKVAPVRSREIPQVLALNKRLSQFASAHDKVRYIDSTTCLLGDDGQPIASMYRNDHLHLSPVGYAHWLIRLDPVLREEWAKVNSPVPAEVSQSAR